MDSKKIFILGAGSSIGHSKGLFPTIEQFFVSAKDLKLHETNSYNQIADYVKEILGKDIKTHNQNIDIENLLTYIEIEIEKNPSPKLLSIRQEILTLIRKLLTRLSEQIATENGEYNKLLKSISDSDTIITYNWDLLLDNLLDRENVLVDDNNKPNTSSKATNHYKDFIHNLTALGEGTLGRLSEKRPYDQWDTKKGYFIKAHGSIDWFYCSNEACRAFRKVFPVLKPENKQHCSACHEQLDCLIIPPVLNKGYRNYPLIRVLWNLAAIEIAHASEIVVWGYSLPPTDFYASWLLRQARKAQLKRLVIINPSLLKKEKSEMKLLIKFIRKYYDIFRDQISKESINNFLDLYESFDDYYSGRDIFTVHNIQKQLDKHTSL